MSAGSSASRRSMARASVVLPAPSGPSSKTARPGASQAASSVASVSVAARSGSARDAGGLSIAANVPAARGADKGPGTRRAALDRRGDRSNLASA